MNVANITYMCVIAFERHSTSTLLTSHQHVWHTPCTSQAIDHPPHQPTIASPNHARNVHPTKHHPTRHNVEQHESPEPKVLSDLLECRFGASRQRSPSIPSEQNRRKPGEWGRSTRHHSTPPKLVDVLWKEGWVGKDNKEWVEGVGGWESKNRRSELWTSSRDFTFSDLPSVTTPKSLCYPTTCPCNAGTQKKAKHSYGFRSVGIYYIHYIVYIDITHSIT